MNHIAHMFTRKMSHRQIPVVSIRLEKNATQEQLDALQVTLFNTKVSEYALTHAHDTEGLAVRSPLFNAIMYDLGGISRAEMETGAPGASMVNSCIYCAAVHANRRAKLEKDEFVTDNLFATGEKVVLTARDRAIFDFAWNLAEALPTTGLEDMEAPRDTGIANEDISYPVLHSALFGRANRLMHVLDEPVRQKDQK